MGVGASWGRAIVGGVSGGEASWKQMGGWGEWVYGP